METLVPSNLLQDNNGCNQLGAPFNTESEISHTARSSSDSRTDFLTFRDEDKIILDEIVNNNINNFDKISIIKPSIKDLKKETIKVIKNIGPKNAKK